MERLFGFFVVFVLLAGLTASVANAADLTSGLVGYWPLDGDFTDLAGDTEGDLVDGADWAAGRVNLGIEFDGSTGYAAISGFEMITDTLTCVAWIKGWRQSAWAGIVVGRGGVPFWMGFTDSDTLSYVWNNDSDQTWGWREGPMIPQDEWAMAAITIEPDKAVAYIYTDADGLEQNTNEIAHIEQLVENLKFGWDECCGADRHFVGIIDEVMMYDRALSEDEISSLAAGGLSVIAPSDGLATRWGWIKK
jgi:hypothetical protein